MPSPGFEIAIQAIRWPQTYALYLTETEIGIKDVRYMHGANPGDLDSREAENSRRQTLYV